MKLTELKHIAIIEAAKAEFIEHGFVAANMDRISQSAEVSKRTLYRHFESKEVLFIAVLALIQEEVTDHTRYVVDPMLSLSDQLQIITQHEVDIIYQTYGMGLCRTIVMEFLRQPELAQDVVEKLYSTRAITRWIKDAIAVNRLKDDDLNTMTQVYSSLFQGFLFWPQMMTLNSPLTPKMIEQKTKTIIEVFLNTYQINE